MHQLDPTKADDDLTMNTTTKTKEMNNDMTQGD